MKNFFSMKMVTAWVIAFLVGLYSTFVALNLWTWFAIPIFHLPNLSFLQLWGLMLLASALMRGNFQTETNGESSRWARWAQPLKCAFLMKSSRCGRTTGKRHLSGRYSKLLAPLSELSQVTRLYWSSDSFFM